MIAGISHDLRTPLTAIRGTIKGLMDGIASSPEKQNQFLQAAYRRTGDMDMLLNQLFIFQKWKLEICRFPSRNWKFQNSCKIMYKQNRSSWKQEKKK